MLDTERLERLRDRVRSLTATARTLMDRIEHVGILEQIRGIEHRIHRIEAVFLNQHDDRTARRETDWLDRAEEALEIFSNQLQAYTGRVPPKSSSC